MATQVASRLRESLKVEVPLRKLFEAKTVAELSDCITSLAPQATDEDIAGILAEIEQLSDEEAQRILAAETEKSARGVERIGRQLFST